MTADASPTIRAYLGLNYQESQIIGEELKQETPIWEADFHSLHQSTTVSITRRADGFFAAYILDGRMPPPVVTQVQVPVPAPAPPPVPYNNVVVQSYPSDDGEVR